MGAILFDIRNKAIGTVLGYVGTISQTTAEPRGFLAPALLANAVTILLFHNHPSGDPSPSQDDIEFTKRMVAAGKVLGIQVLDHLVMGETPPWVSLRQEALCLFENQPLGLSVSLSALLSKGLYPKKTLQAILC
ncbi:MAG: JAB domain-containing protein [bacterium]|nr:JAB domain-containing protein [bacterium]